MEVSTVLCINLEEHIAAKAEQQQRTLFAAHSLSFYTVSPAGIEGIIAYLSLVSLGSCSNFLV